MYVTFTFDLETWVFGDTYDRLSDRHIYTKMCKNTSIKIN